MVSKALLDELEARKQKARKQAEDETAIFRASVPTTKSERTLAKWRAIECAGRKLGYWAGLVDALVLIRKDAESWRS